MRSAWAKLLLPKCTAPTLNFPPHHYPIQSLSLSVLPSLFPLLYFNPMPHLQNSTTVATSHHHLSNHHLLSLLHFESLPHRSTLTGSSPPRICSTTATPQTHLHRVNPSPLHTGHSAANSQHNHKLIVHGQNISPPRTIAPRATHHLTAPPPLQLTTVSILLHREPSLQPHSTKPTTTEKPHHHRTTSRYFSTTGTPSRLHREPPLQPPPSTKFLTFLLSSTVRTYSHLSPPFPPATTTIAVKCSRTEHLFFHFAPPHRDHPPPPYASKTKYTTSYPIPLRVYVFLACFCSPIKARERRPSRGDHPLF